MTQEEINKLALRLYPIYLREDQFTDNNKEKRDGFIFGMEYCKGHRHYKEDDWISVKENLPEEDTEVIILINELYTGTAVYESFGLVFGFNNDHYDDFNSEDVTHWQPLPKSFKN